MHRNVWIMVAQVVIFGSVTQIAEAVSPWGLTKGNVQLQSANSLAFGPDGILLVGDAKAAAIVAIDTQDRTQAEGGSTIDVTDIDKRIEGAVDSQSVQITDLAVNPISKNVYVSVVANGKASILRVTSNGEVSLVSLEGIDMVKVELTDAPADKVSGNGRRKRNLRDDSITDIAYNEGRVLLSGLTSGEAPSSVRELDFPFTDSTTATPVEIFHAAHGRYEDTSAIRTFVPFNIDGQASLLAGFVCTPLVKFSLEDLEGSKVRGTTLAELGNRNRPLDMIVYQQDGKDFLLMANSARGVMKISTNNIERQDGLTKRVEGGGAEGQSYETIETLKGVVQLDKYSDTQAVVLVQSEDGGQALQTIALP